jgi:lysophospholipase L1-like esterase
MVEILLLGDSLVADNNWQRRMPRYKVINMGEPGAIASDLLGSLAETKKKQPHADVVMVMIGTNDLLCGNQNFIKTLREISLQLAKNYPLADTLISALFPMNLPQLPGDTIAQLNAQIRTASTETGSIFLDTHQRFVQSTERIFQDDGVHITEDAYEIWARMLLEHIAFLVDED